MTHKADRPASPVELRRQAEETLEGKTAQAPENLDALSPTEIQRLLHELRVHQIELEMQNDELRRAQLQLDTERARYFDLWDLAPVGYVTVSETGLILEANLTAVNLLGVPRTLLVKRSFSQFLLKEDQDRYYLNLRQIIRTGEPQSYELRLANDDGTSRVGWVHLEATIAQDETGASADPLGPDEGRKSPRWVIRIALSDITMRKRAEEALRENQMMLANILDSAPQNIFWKDLAGEYLGCNENFAQAVGLTSPDQILGKTDYDLPWSRAEADAYRADDREVINQNLPKRHIIEPVRTADGTHIWADTTKIPLLDAAGKPYGVLGVYDDITERKQTEEALRERETALKKAQQVAHVGSWVWHIQQNRLEWSEEMYHIFGINKESFSGNLADVITSAIHPDDRAAVEASNNSVIQDQKPIPLEYRVIWPDGTIRVVWAEAGELIPGPQGKPEALTGIVQDITERKRADDELQRWIQVFQHAEWGITVGSVDGKSIDLMNPAYAKMHGYTVEEMNGWPLADLFAPESRSEIAGNIQLAHQKGHLVWETRHVHKDGHTFPVLIDVTAVKDEAGQVKYRVVNVQDITERKLAEQKINEQLVELRRWYSAMLGREKRTIELKKEVNDLLAQAGQPPRYAEQLKNASE